MSDIQNDPLIQMETTCGSLLYELKIIWDEVGEVDDERDRMLLELEQECLDVYRRKVDHANRSRAQLRQAIADSEAELAAICSAMGERPVHVRQADKKCVTLKEDLSAVLPQLEEMRKRKCDRRKQFAEVLSEIQKVSFELYRSTETMSLKTTADETDLSLRKLDELHKQLQTLQREKSDRLKQVTDHLHTVNSLCAVLGMDFKKLVMSVDPSFGDSEGAKNISSDIIAKLADQIRSLRDIKLHRMQQLQDLVTTMLELWNLMDTPIEEQQKFESVACNVAASEQEITKPNTLSLEFITNVEAEVSRLEGLKASKMKELVLKKKSELEEICRKSHIVLEADSTVEYALETIESGAVDPACVLEQIELQVANLKEEAFGRKDILEKVEKWLYTCEEESWLEEYNRDENRYNAGRGGHLSLKRAEKARSLVNKLPAMMETLASKVTAWEKERGTPFTYDGIQVLSMLEDYSVLRQEKEQERRRQRDQKKLQGQLMAEQEALFGSKPSPSKPQMRRASRVSTGGLINRRLSLAVPVVLQTPKHDPPYPIKATLHSRSVKKSDRLPQNDPLHYHDEELAALSSGRVSMRKHAREPEAPERRVPFSPIPSDASMGNVPCGTVNEDALKKTTLFPVTPCRSGLAGNEENNTPKAMVIPVPSTPPPTISAPMHTATTPNHPSVPHGNDVDEIEYSFEERRAGFVLPTTQAISIVHV